MAEADDPKEENVLVCPDYIESSNCFEENPEEMYLFFFNSCVEYKSCIEQSIERGFLIVSMVRRME